MLRFKQWKNKVKPNRLVIISYMYSSRDDWMIRHGVVDHSCPLMVIFVHQNNFTPLCPCVTTIWLLIWLHDMSFQPVFPCWVRSYKCVAGIDQTVGNLSLKKIDMTWPNIPQSWVGLIVISVQGAIERFWFYFWKPVMLSMKICNGSKYFADKWINLN